MCFNLSAAAWNTNLSGLRKLVYLALCDRADKTGRCWPSMDWIAKQCGICQRAAREHVSALVQQGLIRRELRRGRSTVYFVAIPPTTAAPPAAEPHDDTPASAAPPTPSTPAIGAPAPASTAPRSSQWPTNKKNTEEAPASAAADDDDLVKELIEKWIAVRKLKHWAAPTGPELQALRSEGEKISMSLSDVLKMCVDRGWAHFKAAWLPTPQLAAAPVPVRRPEPVPAPASAEVVSEGLSQLASLRSAIESKICATGNRSLDWAHNVFAKKKAGQPVSKVAVRDACKALGINPRMAFA